MLIKRQPETASSVPPAGEYSHGAFVVRNQGRMLYFTGERTEQRGFCLESGLEDERIRAVRAVRNMEKGKIEARDHVVVEKE